MATQLCDLLDERAQIGTAMDRIRDLPRAYLALHRRWQRVHDRILKLRKLEAKRQREEVAGGTTN